MKLNPTLMPLLFLATMLTSPAVPVDVNSPLDVDLTIHQGAVTLDIETDEDVFYQIEFSTDLVNWDIEGYSFKGTGGRVSKVASGRGLPRAFYRVSDEGDPKNVLIGNPSRIWVVETPNRAVDTTYTNTFGYEICIFAKVGVAAGGDDGASRPFIRTRMNNTTPWITVGGTRTSSRFLQQEGDIEAIIPAGWEYQLLNGAPTSTFPIIAWNELK